MSDTIRVSGLISLAENAEKRYMSLAEAAKNPEVKRSFLNCAENSRRLAEKYRSLNVARITVDEFFFDSDRKQLKDERISRHAPWLIEQWIDLELSETLKEKGKDRTEPWTEAEVKEVLMANNPPFQINDYSSLVVQFEHYRKY